MKVTLDAEHLRELLSADESATVSGMGRRTWWRYVSSGRAPQPVRVGGLVRWRKSELIAWIQAGCPRVRKAVER